MKKYTLFVTLMSLVVVTAQAALNLAPTVPITPPYALTVSDEEERALYTIYDANGDGKTWEGNKWQFRCKTVEGIVADDWLFSPAIHLEAGMSYAIQVVGFNKSSNWPERLEVKAGTAATVAGMTEDVLPIYTYTKVAAEEQNTIFTPATTGDYYFGFHCVSNAGGDYLNISKWSISAPISSTSPDMATQVSVTPAEQGALSATISFVTPTQNIDGTPLTSLTSAVVTNATTGQLVATVSNPEVGQQCTVTDNAPVNGQNRYVVVCYDGDTEGKPADATAFIGIDVPRAIGRGNWVQQGQDVVLTWSAPSTTGVNGGYVNPDAVTYRIEMVMPTYKTIATKVQGLTYTDKSLNGLEGQAFVYYAIYPETVAGQGQATPTFSGPFGTPFDTPMHESFAGAMLTYNPWFTIRHTGSNDSPWDIVASSTNPNLAPQDNDGGMAVVKATDYAEWTLASPIFHLAEGVDHELKFFACQPDYSNTLAVMLSDDACHTWKRLRMVPRTPNNWTEVTVDLSEYAGKDINLGFRVMVDDDANNVAIDNITISSTTSGLQTTSNHDVRVTTRPGMIVVDGATDIVSVYTTDGRICASSSSSTFVVAPGLYIVRTSDFVAKVLVP